jgi:putative ABC transport system permease protein
LGFGGAFAPTRLMNDLLFLVDSRDPLTFAAGAAVLVVASLSACYLPARRAARVDPMVALR